MLRFTKKPVCKPVKLQGLTQEEFDALQAFGDFAVDAYRRGCRRGLVEGCIEGTVGVCACLALGGAVFQWYKNHIQKEEKA